MARKGHNRVQAFLTAAALLLSLPAFAQANRVYEAAAVVPTGIEGVRGFPEAPSSLDPIRASDIDLARYGLPPRPHDPESLARWIAAMSGGARRSHEPFRKMPWYGGPAMRHTKTTIGNSGVKGNTYPETTENWSGNVDFIRGLSAYDPAHSFSQVTDQFTVPYAQAAFLVGGGNFCAGGTGAVGWIGFDGWGSSDVLQGGWFAQSACANGTVYPSNYCLWAEWYPSTPILCQLTAAPGDVVFTEVWSTSATQGYVYVQDLTTNFYQTAAFTCPGDPCLIGNSVEYIVERFSYGNQPVALMNYVRAFVVGGSAETFDGINYAADGWSKSGPAWPIFHVSMFEPDAIGVNETVSDCKSSGRWDLIFNAGGCAMNGGC
jgi:hypothetical protein